MGRVESKRKSNSRRTPWMPWTQAAGRYMLPVMIEGSQPSSGINLMLESGNRTSRLVSGQTGARRVRVIGVPRAINVNTGKEADDVLIAVKVIAVTFLSNQPPKTSGCGICRKLLTDSKTCLCLNRLFDVEGRIKRPRLRRPGHVVRSLEACAECDRRIRGKKNLSDPHEETAKLLQGGSSKASKGRPPSNPGSGKCWKSAEIPSSFKCSTPSRGR
jgi:hypothetical protein